MPQEAKKVRQAEEAQSPMLKMKDLMEATGLPKSTIIHYVNEGLLPQPVKTGPNMAYYHPSTVERIALIKQIQHRMRLPLAAIKGVLREMDKGRDVTPLLELHEHLFHFSNDRIDKESFCMATGLSVEETDEFLERSILSPLEDGLFDEEDIAIGKSLRYGLNMGMKPEEWEFYPRLAEQIVNHEFELRERYTASLGFEQNAEMTLGMTRTARALRAYVIDRIFQRRVYSRKSLQESSFKKPK